MFPEWIIFSSMMPPLAAAVIGAANAAYAAGAKALCAADNGGNMAQYLFTSNHRIIECE